MTYKVHTIDLFVVKVDAVDHQKHGDAHDELALYHKAVPTFPTFFATPEIQVKGILCPTS